MSGKKCSAIQYDPERERRSQLARQISTASREVEGLREQMSSALQQASAGVKDHLAIDVQDMQEWLRQTETSLASSGQWSMSQSAMALAAGLVPLQDALEGGRVTQQKWVASLSRVGRVRSDYRGLLARLEGTLRAERPFLEQWLGNARHKELEQALEGVRHAVQADLFGLAERRLRAFTLELAQASEQAQSQEATQIRQDQAQALVTAKREVQSELQTLQHILASTSPGLQNTFADETAGARQWTQRATDVCERLNNAHEMEGVSELRAATQDLGQLRIDGQRASDKIRIAYGEEAGQLRTKGEAQVSAASVLLSGGRELLTIWFGAEATAKLDTALNALREHLLTDRLLAISDPAEALRQEVLTKIRQAEAQEAKHQRRVYLLKALRQVCHDMGFREAAEPCYERQGDRSSRIILTTDTFAHGLVTFHLSLEGIEADACISKTHCFDEFDALSDQLARQFGVQTAFQMADGSPRPPRISQDGLSEPKNEDQVMRA